MRIFTVLLFIIIFSGLNVYSQSVGISISGNVKDAESGKDLISVNIVVRGSKSGTTTDKSGYFRLKLYKVPVTLGFSMVGYKKQSVNINEYSDQHLDIRLEPKVTVLTPVAIYGDKVVNIIKDTRLYVADYEFYDDNILLLAYKNKKIARPFLIYMTFEGDTICSRMLKKAGELYTDGLDYTHIITRTCCHQIEIDSNGIEFYYPTPKEEFFEIISKLDDATEEIVYLHHYYKRNQILSYYDYNRTDSSFNEFRTITDEQGITMLFDNDRWGLFAFRNEHEARFEEMCFADPIYAPLFVLDDSIYIINFVESQIEQYSSEGEELKVIHIEFNNNKNIKEKIYIDEVKSKVYAIFKRSGITTLREIDLKTGKLTASIQVPSYSFIENIKIRDDVVYFLYKERINEEYKQLYKLALSSYD